MLIERLELKNFGIYGGLTTLDLSQDENDQKPLTIVRGHNGAGKTTLLTAIRLALYGDKVIPEKKLSINQFEKFLRERIHYGSGREGSFIELHLSNLGTKYRVKRTWRMDQGKLVHQNEYFTQTGDFEIEPLDDESWTAIIDELIPEGVSQFFFFDGEKIQEIADQEKSENLNYAIRSLLGLNLIERLRKDILIFLQKNKSTDQTFELDFKSLEIETEKCLKALNDLRRDRADLNQAVHSAKRNVEAAETRLFKEGGLSENVQSEIRSSDIFLKEKRDLIKSEIVEILSNEMVFQLAPNALSQLGGVAAEKRKTSEQKIILDFITNLKGKGYTKSEVDKLRGLSELTKAPDKYTKISLSPNTMALIARISEAPSISERNYGAILEDIVGEISELKSKIIASEEAAAKKSQSQLLRARTGLQASEENLTQIDQSIRELEKNLNDLNSKKKSAEDQLIEQSKSVQQLDLAAKSIQVIQRYEDKILERRLDEISENFVTIFSKLTRKPDLISSIEIEPSSFKITLKGNTETGLVDRNKLSAGERQLYAISLLWALGKVSGKNIPLIIDTPFSRLDNETREKIVKHYIPYAAKQIIILFTDSELTKELEPKLKKIANRSIEIDVEPGQKGNRIQVGLENAA